MAFHAAVCFTQIRALSRAARASNRLPAVAGMRFNRALLKTAQSNRDTTGQTGCWAGGVPGTASFRNRILAWRGQNSISVIRRNCSPTKPSPASPGGGSSNPFVAKSNFGLESPKFDFCNPSELLLAKTQPGCWAVAGRLLGWI